MKKSIAKEKPGGAWPNKFQGKQFHYILEIYNQEKKFIVNRTLVIELSSESHKFPLQWTTATWTSNPRTSKSH